MRPLEILIPILTAIYIAYPLIAGSKHPAWMNLLPLITLALVIIHLATEKYRWQMVPIYIIVAATATFAGAALVNPSTGQITRFSWQAAGIVLSLVVLGLATALPAILPVPKLLEPDGPYKVGTTTLFFTDDSRKEIYSGKDEQRKFLAQVWYPATPAEDAKPIPWMTNAEVFAPETAKNLGFPPFFIDHAAMAMTSTYLEAPPDHSGGPYPVLVFSHGWTGFSFQNTFQVQELVSHGYVVVGMEYPYASVVSVFPDGEVAHNNPDALPYNIEDVDESETLMRKLVNQWAGDISFALDKIAVLNENDPNGLLTGMMDWDRIGLFGHSTGGGATIEFCGTDPRCKAGLTMDAFMRPVSLEVLDKGTSQPFFYMFSEAWPFERNTALFNRYYSNSAPQNRVVTILGTKHYDFTDLPALSPLAPQLGLKGPIKGTRVQEIINTYSLSFFDMALKGIDSPLFDGPSTEFPDVRFDR